MRGQTVVGIHWCSTLLVAFAAAIFLLYRCFQPAVDNSWQKAAWLICTAALLVPFVWLIIRFAGRRLAGFSVLGRACWIVGALLAGMFLIITIPLPTSPSWKIASSQQTHLQTADKTASIDAGIEGRPFWKEIVFHSSDAICLALPLLISSLWLATRHETPADKPYRWAWLAYASPCALVWSYYLWVFWPGLMSYDSFYQWHQFLTGRLNDWHPAFHTMTSWLITRAWYSPAAIASVQIIVLSMVIGWGLARMRQKGMPRWLATTICLAIALSPANGATVVTLWKDVPYSICLLLLGLFIVEIVTSEGRWLDGRWAWVFLGLAAALAALLRHNGLPVAIGIIAVLLLVYRQRWRKLSMATLLVFGCYFGVRGPLYSYAGVESMPSALKYCMVLHHIAAHMDAGTPLSEEQKAMLSQVHPLANGQWPYDPTNISSLFDEKIDKEAISAHQSDLVRLCLSLAVNRPQVDVMHVIRNSTMVWRITEQDENCSMLACNIVNKKGLRIDPEIREDPSHAIGGPLVEVKRALPPLLAASIAPKLSWIIWRSAFFLYLLIIGAIIAAVRARRWQYLLFVMPAAMQSLSLVIFCPSCDMRYQWSVCLMGMVVSGFALWSTPLRTAASAQEPLPETAATILQKHISRRYVARQFAATRQGGCG